MIDRQIIKQILQKAYRDVRLRTAAAGVFALVWWSVLYPELCFTDSTYTQIIVMDGQEIEAEQPDCRDVLNAAGDEIVIKSRLLEWLEEKTGNK